MPVAVRFILISSKEKQAWNKTKQNMQNAVSVCHFLSFVSHAHWSIYFNAIITIRMCSFFAFVGAVALVVAISLFCAAVFISVSVSFFLIHRSLLFEKHWLWMVFMCKNAPYMNVQFFEIWDRKNALLFVYNLHDGYLFILSGRLLSLDECECLCTLKPCLNLHF